MAFDYEKYQRDIEEFISIVVSEGYEFGYHDQRKMTIGFIVPFQWESNGVFEDIDIIEDIASEVFDVGWITDIRPVGRDNIVLKYTDFYM